VTHHDRPGQQLLCAPTGGPQDGRKGPQPKPKARAHRGSWSFGEDERDPAAWPEHDAQAAAAQDDSSAMRDENDTQPFGNPPGELQILQGAAIFKDYLQRERSRHRPKGSPLKREWTAALHPFFSSALLSSVRILELRGQRTPNPPFYAQARSLGFTNLPDISHQASVTFLDVVVFHENVEERKLFHGLVHAAQVQILGLDRYVELFVRGFLKRKSYFMVPLKAHAFALDLRFVVERSKPFSVEEEIRHWARVGLY